MMTGRCLLANIAITTLPDQTTYIVGEELDLTG